VRLQKEFFDIYSIDSDFNKNINDLNEENFSESKNYLKLQNLNDEINYISYLINITDEKLLKYENDKKNINSSKKPLTLTIKDILDLIDKANNNGKEELISVKSDDKSNLDFVQDNEPKNNLSQKKSEENQIKTLYDDEYDNLCQYSNKLYITSKNNKPINISKIDMRNIKLKDKDELTNFKINSNKDNFINLNDLINNDNNDYKSEVINLSPIKSKIRKDSVVSDFPNYGNLRSNIFLDQNIFTNMNNFNLMSMNKLENEIY
jgi:hypothetical protein